MRQHSLVVVMSLAFVAACGTTSTGSPATTQAPSTSMTATAVAPTVDRSASSGAAADGSSAPGGARAMGTDQLIHTANFDARVTATTVPDPGQNQGGDAPYTVDVQVQMIRGDWTVLASPIQLVYANGAVFDPIEVPGEDGSAEILEGESNSWQFSYEASAGAGIGDGARPTITSSAGKLLATWLT